MVVLIVFAFAAGIVTILSPCILPVLPVVLSGSITGGKRRPYGVMIGFIASFSFFTLFLSAIVKLTGISANNLRLLSVAILFVFGLTLIAPHMQTQFEQLAARLIKLTPKHRNGNLGFWGGLIVGLSLGLIWTPCVGPILASVITIATTSSVGGEAMLITLAYAFGTSIPLLLVTYGGRQLLQKNRWFVINSRNIQKVFGILMLVTSVAIYLNLDRTFQTYVLKVFPAYGTGLTALENNAAVDKELSRFEKKSESGIAGLTDFLSSDLGKAPEIIPGGKWFNLPDSNSETKGLTVRGLQGKVILVDFWTYTCINCIRTLPYLEKWYETYRDKGFIIIGVHTPEFEFEKDAGNVARAIGDFGLTYPVVQDNDYRTWNAYDNHYWPAKYLINAKGKIVYTHFGEGDDDKTEKMIQTLLQEAGSEVNNIQVRNPSYSIKASTPESYLGYRRIEFLSSPENAELFTPVTFTVPQHIPESTFALRGVWKINDEYASPEKDSGLVYRFNAMKVFLVARPKTEGVYGTVKIFLDGKNPGIFAGDDTKNGFVTVNSDRLYNLIKLDAPGVHELRLEFPDNKLELYAFTFG